MNVEAIEQQLGEVREQRRIRVAEHTALLDEADAADQARQQLGDRRQALLVLALRDKNATASQELAELPTKMAALAQRATNCREAAQQLEPRIAALDPDVTRLSDTLRNARYASTFERFARQTADVERALGSFCAIAEAWLPAAEQFARDHRVAYGTAAALDTPPFALARFVKHRLVASFGPQAAALDRRYPVDAGSLSQQLTKVAPRAAVPAAEPAVR